MSARFRTAALYLFAAVIAVWSPEAGGESDLYSDSINQPSTGSSKGFVMSFTEVERQPHYSIIKVKYTSGSSVGSAMYVVKGCWEIARQRGMEYFINLKEWRDSEGNGLMKVGFTNDRSVDLQTYFGEYDQTKELKFLSVTDYAPLWQR
jgi:hypothetical protein